LPLLGGSKMSEEASGDNQKVSVDGAIGATPRKVFLAPPSSSDETAPTILFSGPLKPTGSSANLHQEHFDDMTSCELQQRIAKVKCHSADISKQLDKLCSQSELPT